MRFLSPCLGVEGPALCVVSGLREIAKTVDLRDVIPSIAAVERDLFSNWQYHRLHHLEIWMKHYSALPTMWTTRLALGASGSMLLKFRLENENAMKPSYHKLFELLSRYG